MDNWEELNVWTILIGLARMAKILRNPTFSSGESSSASSDMVLQDLDLDLD